MSDRPRVRGGSGGGRGFTSEDWERGAAGQVFGSMRNVERAGLGILRDVVRGEIKENSREADHQRRMEINQQRHGHQMERGGFRHQQQMETRQMTRESRGGRSFGTPDFNGDARYDRQHGNQPGERGYNGDTRRMRVDGDRANPGDPREYRQQRGQQPENREMNEVVQNSEVGRRARALKEVTSETGAQTSPVRSGEIEVRALPPVKQEFKTAAQGQTPGEKVVNYDGPDAIKVSSTAPAKLTEDKRDYTTMEVSKGDSLWKLAKGHYGEDLDNKTLGKYVNAIAERNGMDAKAANNLEPGQKIKMPDNPFPGPNTPDVASTVLAQAGPKALTPGEAVVLPAMRPDTLGM